MYSLLNFHKFGNHPKAQNSVLFFLVVIKVPNYKNSKIKLCCSMIIHKKEKKKKVSNHFFIFVKEHY